MIKIGIVGYGNLGKGVELAVKKSHDMRTAAIFTRRNPQDLQMQTADAALCRYEALPDFRGKLDVIVNCGGSATDLPQTTPEIARDFCVIDSFDTHAAIAQHFDAVNAAAERAGTLAIISVGWDPGLFSLNRLYMNAVLPDGEDVTFWGRGVSQGHSDAIRRIPGVLDARQYTVPSPAALEAARRGELPASTIYECHTRECYVVAAEQADRAAIEKAILHMPNYFAPYQTTVTFITAEEMRRNHSRLPHGGCVIRTGFTGEGNKQERHKIEYSLSLSSNPAFSGSVLTAYARAAYRLAKQGQIGCRTVLDIPPVYLLDRSDQILRSTLL